MNDQQKPKIEFCAVPHPRPCVGVFGCCAGLPLVTAVVAGFFVGEPDTQIPLITVARADESSQKPNLAAWGSDHVGQPVPEFVTGDECLFCHRKDVGPTWSTNRHQFNVRTADPNAPELKALGASPATKTLAGEVEFLMGGTRRTRFLKRGKDYGTLALHSIEYQPGRTTSAGTEGDARPLTAGPSPARGEGRKADRVLNTDRLLHAENPRWDDKTFGRKCAGCHATGVDAKSHAFAAISLDCFVCHGDATLDHSKDTSKIILAKARHDEPRVIVSICAQCHVRTGKSRSTGLPYANNFIAGDNLFRDFEVDFSDAELAKLNPGDRHVLENVRDVVVLKLEGVTCLSCHNVHKPSSRKHYRVAAGSICLNCHNAEGPKSRRPAYEVHSPLCGY